MQRKINIKVADLKRYYQQKQALISKKDTGEYNERQYSLLMKFYNESIKRKRSELSKIAPATLLKLDRDRRNESAITTRTEFEPDKPRM